MKTAIHSKCAKCGQDIEGDSMMLTSDKKLYHLHCSPYDAPPLPKECTCEPVAWLIQDSDGVLTPQATTRPQEPDPTGGLIISPLFLHPSPTSTHRTAGETIGGGVQIKPLQWEQPDGDMATETSSWLGHGTDLCQYYIGFQGGSWWTPFDGEDGDEYPTIEDAKAAAQSEYEARIRSALAPPPVEPVQGVTEAKMNDLDYQIRQIVDDAINSAIPEPWEVSAYATKRIIALIVAALAAAPEGSGGAHHCPICAKPFEPADLCATDIELGTCHAACLEGSPTVDLETGDSVDGPIPTFRYDEGAK